MIVNQDDVYVVLLGAFSIICNCGLVMKILQMFFSRKLVLLTAGTIAGLRHEIKMSTKALIEAKTSTVSVSSGCELFVRFITLTSKLEEKVGEFEWQSAKGGREGLLGFYGTAFLVLSRIQSYAMCVCTRSA